MSEASGSETPDARSRGAGWRNRDHTQGSLASSLFVLALPLVASGVLGGVVFQIADLSFVSRLGEAPLAAVIIANQTLRQVFFLIAMGLGFATQSLVSRAVGAGDLEGAEHIAGQAFALAGLVSLGVAAVGWFFAEPLFALPGPDPSFAEYGVPYLRWIYVLNFGVLGTMLFSSILGGAGDTTTPLFVQLVQFGVAILAEWVLIFGHWGAPELGVRGAAFGIVSGQFAAMALGMWVLFRGKARVHLRRRHLRPDPGAMASIAKIAWLPTLQMCGGVATSFAFVRLTGSYGEEVQTAFAISLRVGMILPMVCFPLAGACSTLVGQALGAGDVPRAWRAIGIGLLVHGTLMWSIAAVILAYRVEILELLSDDPEVIRVGADFLWYAAASFFLFAVYFIVLRSLQGAGDFGVPMLLTLSNAFVVTIPLGFLLAERAGYGAEGVAMAQFIGAIFVTVTTSAWLLTGRWTRGRAHSARP
ncbi:MAG: MATE family efflux transporter [Myxococcota bacterium]